MGFWTRARRDRKEREKWDARLTWYRLRYEEAAAVQQALVSLSRPRAAGRVALYFEPGHEVSRLYAGVPVPYGPLLQRMAGERAVAVRAVEPPQLPPAPLSPAGELPWDRQFLAHIVDGNAFVERAGESGRFLPQPPGTRAGRWQLPALPPAGVALRPSWNGHLSAISSASDGAGHGGWPLGWGAEGDICHAPGAVNVYGRPEAVAAWLVELISCLLATAPAGLVLIDGAGDVAPVLKRKPLVTSRLGKEIGYVDVDGAAVASGFNPLAPLPAVTESGKLRRWQDWFAAMGSHPAGLAQLEGAQQAGVTDLAALRQWLEQPAQQHRPAAARSLQRPLQRLREEPQVREWLSWPAQPFAMLPAGALLFCCRGDSWGRRQVLQAALLAARNSPQARLVLHGLPWKELALPRPEAGFQPLVANGPPLPGAAVVLARCEPAGAGLLARNFFNGSAWWQEALELLGRGEAVVLREGATGVTHWQRPSVAVGTEVIGRSPAVADDSR